MSDLAELEEQRAKGEKLIEVRNMALRLHQNPDFKKLIVDGFMTTEAARYVQEAGDPALSAEDRADALNIALASGHLKRFLSVCVQMGSHAERTRPELDAAIAEARAEDEGEAN